MSTASSVLVVFFLCAGAAVRGRPVPILAILGSRPPSKARLANGLATLAVVLLLPYFTFHAQAETQTFGPFRVNTGYPEVVEMNGDIDVGTALDFRRALTAAPAARVLTLNSQGGTVQIGLIVADDVYQRKMATVIPKGSRCYSACAYIFLAGVERLVEGELGVHQISSDAPNLQSTQSSISDIIDLLNRFGTPIDVLTIMFRTPAAEMHVFTVNEIEKFGINRKASAPPTGSSISPSDTSVVPNIAATAPVKLPEGAADELTAEPPAGAQAKLSALEEYARQPNRMAVYPGLDFFGSDIGSASVADAVNCAQRCFEAGSACKAFTYNVLTPVGRGPNCFLKSERGRLDGNSAAISGYLLSRAEPDPQSHRLGVIDPNTGLHRDMDLTGDDLSSRPRRSAKTPQQCRFACIGSSRCFAFTFDTNKSECWLKSGIGQPRVAAGMISGTKTMVTISPSTIDLRR